MGDCGGRAVFASLWALFHTILYYAIVINIIIIIIVVVVVVVVFIANFPTLNNHYINYS